MRKYLDTSLGCESTLIGVEVMNTAPGKPAQLLRVEYTVVTRADRTLAWEIFSDWRQWYRFSDIYGDIRWIEGKPWTPGSRLQIELLHPVRAMLDHVITACSPGNFVAWIDHAHANTMEQWVHFKTLTNGATEIRTWAELLGPTQSIEGSDVREIVTNFIRSWYSNFSEECDRLASEIAFRT
jgi:hypothetical protein